MASTPPFQLDNVGRRVTVRAIADGSTSGRLRYELRVSSARLASNTVYLLTPAELKQLGMWIAQEISYRKGIRGERDYDR